MEEKLKEAWRRTMKEMKDGMAERRGWWDEEYGEEKREVRRELRKWRKEGEGEKYRKKKGNYKKLCERKKREENERWEKKVAGAKRESEVWEIMNRRVERVLYEATRRSRG